MIVVITGTEQFSFHRLVQQIDRLKGEGVLQDDVFVQLGSCSFTPEHCEWERFLGFADLAARVDEADVIIAHAGAGTTLLCVERGKRPILVPRRKVYNEHVDDHQVPFSRMMSDIDVAILVDDVQELADAIAGMRRDGTGNLSKRPSDTQLAEYVDSLLDEWFAPDQSHEIHNKG